MESIVRYSVLFKYVVHSSKIQCIVHTAHCPNAVSIFGDLLFSFDWFLPSAIVRFVLVMLHSSYRTWRAGLSYVRNNERIPFDIERIDCCILGVRDDGHRVHRTKRRKAKHTHKHTCTRFSFKQITCLYKRYVISICVVEQRQTLYVKWTLFGRYHRFYGL